MSAVQNLGTDLMAVGGAAVGLGSTIAAYGATLPDSTPGSAREVVSSVGLAVSAVGGALVSIGAYIHNRFHANPPPVQSPARN